MTRKPTEVAGSSPERSRSATRVDTTVQDASAEPPRSSNDTRKLSGVLVTFTWRPQGELFEIREGKNFIGRGTVESEGGRPCEVQITTDAMLSNEHALILCRAGRYQLFDQRSTSGTFLNDEFVENQGVELSDRAKIKTGATIWTFLKIDGGTPVSQYRTEEPPAAHEEDIPRSTKETKVR